jgi:hypothetical protein
MKPEHLGRLVSALQTQRSQIRALMQSPERDPANLHFLLASILRSMLCDKDWPTLIALANEISIDLRVWGPYPPTAASEEPPTCTFDALVASSTPEMDAYEMSAVEYLDSPIGAIFEVGWYTPRQLIKWVSNKEGASHFDPKLPQGLHSLNTSFIIEGTVSMVSSSGSIELVRNDALPVRMALLQIAEWAAQCADIVLDAYTNTRI